MAGVYSRESYGFLLREARERGRRVCGDGEGPLLPSGARGHPAHTASARGLVSPSLREHQDLVTAHTHASRNGCCAVKGGTDMQIPSRSLVRLSLLQCRQAPCPQAWAGPERPGGPGSRWTTQDCLLLRDLHPVTAPLWASVSLPKNKGSHPVLFHIGNSGF